MICEINKNGTVMKVLSLGAEPQSLVKDGVEYIWNGDKEYWFRHAPLLFPMIGPTKDDKIAAKGREYSMPNNGFARDTEFELVEKTEDSVTFRLEDSEETRSKYYPYGFVLTATYTVREDGYEAKAEIRAKEDLWYTFGWHPAFSLDMNGKGTDLETYSVSFEQNEKLDRKYAKDGVFVTEKDFVVGDTLQLTRAETDKGAIILSGVKSSEVTLTSTEGEHGITAFMGDMPMLTVWTCAPKHGQYVCIEPMLSFGDTTRPLDIEKMEETKLLKGGESVTYTNFFRIF